MKKIQLVFQDPLLSWAQETWHCNFIFFFLRRVSEIKERSGSAKLSSLLVSPTESYKRDKGRVRFRDSRMPGRISLGEFHSLQVTVRATHFSVFCSSAVGTFWICQEFRIPVNRSPCALFSLTDWVFAWSLNLTYFKRIRGLNSPIKIMSGSVVMLMSRISHSTDPQDQNRDHDPAFCKELPWWQDAGGAVSPTYKQDTSCTKGSLTRLLWPMGPLTEGISSQETIFMGLTAAPFLEQP